MESPVEKRRRILLLFLFGVGLPSIGLGYLAFRGIRNEMALQEQRGLAEYRILSQRITDTLTATVRAAEEEVVRPNVAGPARSRMLGDVAERHPVVDEVFLLDTLGSIRLPWARLLYLPDGTLPKTTRAWSPEAAAYLQSARQLEFARRDPVQALASYRKAFEAAGDRAQRGDVLLAMARVQRKAGHVTSALASCQVLASEYGQVRTAAGVLLGPVARLERGSLLLARGDTEASLREMVSLYRDLVDGVWPLEQAEYVFLRREARDSIAGAMSRSPPSPITDSLTGAVADIEKTEAPRLTRTQRRLRFAQAAREPLATRILPARPGSQTQGFRLTLEIAGDAFLVGVPSQSAGPDGVVGVLFDADAIADLLTRTLGATVDPLATEWILKGRDGRTLWGGDGPPTGPATLTVAFPDNFPPWLLELHQRPQSPARLFFASSRSVYSYMLLLIAAIMGFGLVLTARTVTQELELARLKSDFLSSVSHEFRSPLTSIRHLAEMLQAGSVPSEERRRRYYDVLVEQSARLSNLVTNILDLARIEEGRQEFHFEAVHPEELIEDVVDETRHRVQHEGFVVEAHIQGPLPSVLADRITLAQALSNLLDNAARYSRDSRRIEVHASAGATHVTIAVTDQGIGIPAGELGKVFDRFYRGENARAPSVQGSGLGLALVREIVETHGGTVRVESEVGRGSTFSIRLPKMKE